MKNSKLQITILIILMFSIIGALYYNYYLKLEIAKVQSIKREIVVLKEKQQKLSSKAATIDNEIKEAKKQSFKLDQQIPDTYDKKVLITYFYNSIKQYGVTSDQISFNEVDNKLTDCITANITLKVDGPIENIKAFAKSIENDNRKFSIKQLSIAQSGGAYSGNFLIECYALK